MSGSSGNPSLPNGSGPSGAGPDPLQRLSSFKPPRDLTLGGAKPNKKVFTPNLNVSRNKNKTGLPTVTKDKRDNDRGKKDRKNERNKNPKNGPNIIKSSGVFSEGMGTVERKSTRLSIGRDADSGPVTMQRPTIRVKDVWKIDKEFEQKEINKVMGDSPSDDGEETEEMTFDKDAPVKLPLSDGGWLHSKPKALYKAKQEVTVKTEPLDEDSPSIDEKKPLADVKKESAEETDIVSLLSNDKPTLIMFQFPDSLPGQSRAAADDAPRRKPRDPNAAAAAAEDDKDTEPADPRCRLQDLEEGKVGRLLLHRSGRARLALGDAVFEVSAGTKASFRQEVVSVAVDEDSRSANLISLGPVPHKLNLLPHWESLLADISLK